MHVTLFGWCSSCRIVCVWFVLFRKVHLLLKDAFPFGTSRPLEADMLTIEDAKRKHRSFPENLQRRYMGFFYKRGRSPDSAVEVHFMFNRFRDVEFKPCIGYDSYQASCNISCLCCIFFGVHISCPMHFADICLISICSVKSGCC